MTIRAVVALECIADMLERIVNVLETERIGGDVWSHEED